MVAGAGAVRSPQVQCRDAVPSPEPEPERPGPIGPAPDDARSPPPFAPDGDPVVEAYKRDIDRTLLRQNLRRTVEERVRNLMALAEFAEEAERVRRARDRRR